MRYGLEDTYLLGAAAAICALSLDQWHGVAVFLPECVAFGPLS